jgi:3-hydroxyisobutyrate dehydrogenase-like beta-hydroxyacid dehydrogenase
VLSVPGDPYVEAVVESADGALSGLADGGADVVIDAGTTRLHVDAEYARQCRDRGAGYLDTPVP